MSRCKWVGRFDEINKKGRGNKILNWVGGL